MDFNRTATDGIGNFTVPAMPSATGRTVETAARPEGGSSSPRLFGENALPCLYLNSNRIGMWCNGGMDGAVCERSVFDPIGHFSTYGVSVDISTKYTVAHFGGARYTAKTTTCSPTYSTALNATFANRPAKGAGTVGMFYALRVYDRVLTDDEVAMNAALDRLRFDGADPEDVGYRWNGETGNLEFRVVVRAIDGGTLTIGGQQGVVAVTNWVSVGESFDVHAIAVPAEGAQFVIWRGKSVPDAQRTTAEIQCTVTSADDIAAKFIADGAVYWTFNEADNTITHNASGQVLKAERAIGGLTLAGFSTTPSVAEVNLLDPIYSPDFGEDLPIVAIKDSAFQDNLVLERFIMPDSVLTIGQHAFNGCDNLGYIRMSANVVSIGYRAFYGKQGGISRYFDPEPVPPSVTKLDGNAFAFSWLTNDLVRLCNPALTTIGSEAFSRVSPRVFDMRGSSIKTIGDSLIYGDSRLENLYFPKSLKSVTMNRNFTGNCYEKRIFFSGDPITFIAENALRDTPVTGIGWYLPKWNKAWEEFLADPVRCELTEITATESERYAAAHPDEPLPTATMRYGSPSPDVWIVAKYPMSLCFWYPDDPPPYEPVTYFDILGWEKQKATVSEGDERLFDGTTWTPSTKQDSYVWFGAADAVVTYELGEACTNARALKLTGYRLHQASITKDNKNVQLMPNGRAPTAWTLEGRTLGGDWVTLDTQTMTAASEKHWAYFDYGTYSETVPPMAQASLEYAIHAAKQDSYTAFRFTPTSSRNAEANLDDPTPYSLMEIEFIGLVTTAEPRIGAFAVEESAWNSIDFTATVAGLGDNAAKDQHSQSAKGWVELSETEDFAVLVASSAKLDVTVNAAQTYRVNGLQGDRAYFARLVVRNDLELESVQPLDGQAATLASPFALGELSAGADEDGVLTVGFSLDRLYAPSAQVTLSYAAVIGGEAETLKTLTVTSAGAVDFGTLSVKPEGTSTVRVDVTTDGKTESREANVFSVWVLDAASNTLRQSKNGVTFAVTVANDNEISLSSAVELGGVTAFDFTEPFFDRTGKAYRLVSVGTAFNGNANVTEVLLPDGVKAIPANAFYGAALLHKLRLPADLESIGASAFYNCGQLSEVEPCLPASCTSIGTSAFYNSGLIEVVLSDAMTELSGSAFEGSAKLTKVTLPAHITKIGGSAFQDCTSLKTVLPKFLPDSVSTLTTRMFNYAAVESDELYLTNPNIESLPELAFNHCNLKRVDLSATKITSLGEGLSSMGAVKEYVFPKSFEQFTGRSFSGMNGTYQGVKVEFKGKVPVINYSSTQGLTYNSGAKFLFTADRSNEDWQKYIADNLNKADPEDGVVYVREPTSAEIATYRKYFPHERMPQYMIALHPYSMMKNCYAYFRWKSAGFLLFVR